MHQSIPAAFIMKRESDSKKPLKHVSIPDTGGTLRLKEDGITIVFPTGFIAQPSLTFECSVSSHVTSSNFPPDIRPVSAVLSLGPRNFCDQFLKPIEITMPHFIDLDIEENCQGLRVFVAGSDDCNEGLEFKELSEGASISLSTSWPYKHRTHYVTFSTDHCCFFCIGRYFKKDTDEASLVLTKAESTLTTNAVNQSRELFLHLCFHYNLPTCIEVSNGNQMHAPPTPIQTDYYYR
jgi:hypothetical protein